MDRFNELKQLWQEAAPRPALSASELIAAIGKQRRALLLKTTGSIFALIATIPVMIWVFISYQPVYATTRFGIVLCMLAVIGGILMQSPALRTLLLPVEEDVDNKAMIAALQRLQLKNKRINTTYISVYFLVLGFAMALYLFEFIRGNVWFGITAYSLTFGWIAFAWFYLRPRTIKKQNAALDTMIQHLQSLQKDFEE